MYANRQRLQRVQGKRLLAKRGELTERSFAHCYDEWMNPHDPDARITKMKDGSTHLAHKAEHAADMETGAVARPCIPSNSA